MALASAARADVFHQGMLSLTGGDGEASYRLLADLPANLASRGELTPPDGCVARSLQRYRHGDRATQLWRIDCEAPLRRGALLTLPYALDAAQFDMELGGERLRRMVPGSGVDRMTLEVDAALPAQRPLRDTATDYLWQGVVHILIGWDHLAFVLCLCLLASGLSQLLWAITLFTVGHSLSLGLGFFGLVSLPLPPVEAVIALSIVFVARDAWLRSEGWETGKLARAMLPLVAIFGLIHGLGFAAVLQALGVAGDERLAALAFFNIGVEIGQLGFVAVVMSLRAAIARFAWAPLVDRAALLCAGVIGGYWTLERISGFATLQV